ncbi:MAG: valine--tRNA ligase [Alphaproteobacteria bacterium]|nr:valine--tRNA ligase [Alphaproteobacteria bacterium]
MLEKTYNPATTEQRLYDAWEEAGAFACGQKPGAESYCIVIPPPNVTGSLHMGHALNNTVQDILVRFERMRGKDVLWQPGMDHAGIATQMVVERQLMENQEPSRWDLGREKFVERVWEWKALSGGTINGQLRRLGASCDWSRERFTMDEGLSQAVLKVFVSLFKDGLIFKDKRLVNWDPKLLTAISDLEVVQVESKGHLWHFKYPIKDEPGRFITVATTRPETMLGDSGVAVHPDDERYADLVGKTCVLPLVGREIPIVADEYADPEQGSGAVKMTPAHDFNDFEVGKRQNLRLINVFDRHARLALKDNEEFVEGVEASKDLEATLGMHGMDRFEARKQIVERMEAAGLLQEIEDHEHALPYGDRSNVIIEPFLTEQWYVDAETLAKPAIKAVEDGDTVFVPKNWEKTYFEWMRNIQPWCISRQLWWGHQIPAWYGPDGEVFVEETEGLALAAAERHYGTRTMLERDEDVLDTWFSSALWPFSTLGWPEETEELKRYYKTDVLVTGFDIIFFWVARMMMFGMHFMKDENGVPEVPFREVYIHALVRDEKGAKMSKSKGNIIDPLELIDEYGADPLRFTLAAMAAQGRDIKLAKSRIEGYRNFSTKIWNAARFLEMNECVRAEGFDPAKLSLGTNRWIAGEVERTTAAVTAGIEQHRYNEAAGALYRFVWNVYCDWYLELVKPVLSGEDGAAKTETKAAAAWAFDQILLVMHPFMPFITEELWQVTGEVGPARETWLISADWPNYSGLQDASSDAEIDWVIRLVTEIRSVRAEMNVPAGAKVPCVIAAAGEEQTAWTQTWTAEIMRLARLESISFADSAPEGAVQAVMDEAVVALPLGSVIDAEAESARLQKELGKIDGELKGLAAKLANESFTSRAPGHVVEEQRSRQVEAQAKAEKLNAALERLKTLG